MRARIVRYESSGHVGLFYDGGQRVFFASVGYVYEYIGEHGIAQVCTHLKHTGEQLAATHESLLRTIRREWKNYGSALRRDRLRRAKA